MSLPTLPVWCCTLLLSAADEAQLNDKLGFILDERILLEKE